MTKLQEEKILLSGFLNKLLSVEKCLYIDHFTSHHKKRALISSPTISFLCDFLSKSDFGQYVIKWRREHYNSHCWHRHKNSRCNKKTVFSSMIKILSRLLVPWNYLGILGFSINFFLLTDIGFYFINLYHLINIKFTPLQAVQGVEKFLSKWNYSIWRHLLTFSG